MLPLARQSSPLAILGSPSKGVKDTVGGGKGRRKCAPPPLSGNLRRCWMSRRACELWFGTQACANCFRSRASGRVSGRGARTSEWATGAEMEWGGECRRGRGERGGAGARETDARADLVLSCARPELGGSHLENQGNMTADSRAHPLCAFLGLYVHMWAGVDMGRARDTWKPISLAEGAGESGSY